MMTITRRPLLQRVAAFTCGSAIVFGAGLARPLADTDKVVAVRYEDRILARLAEQGLARSATLRDLVAQLERAQVIVYATISRNLDGGVGGRLRFVGHSKDGWRFLHIEVDDRGTRLELLAMLGHELQHAVEVAGSCDVVDADSMAALYDRIGFPSAGGRKTPGTTRDYETRAAIDTGKRVYSELLGNHW